MKQEEALNLLKMGKNVFLTGEAGSGKTYLLNQYIHYLKSHRVEVAVTASTGIAATHLHGTTIHFWSGIGVKDHITQKDLENLKKEERIKRHYKKTKVLIIDEISMLHAYQLDMVDIIARCILENELPFGGIQVVLCGDFFQLPPVSSSAEKHEKIFAFEGAAWKEGNFNICYLHEQHRQGDDPLLAVLKDIRSGTAGEHTKIPLRTRYKKEPHGSTKATKLYSRNINVDMINNIELGNIQGEEKIFEMISDGIEGLVKSLKKNCLASEKLKLKIGAEVIFIKNDLLGRYVNGTRSVVVGFDKREGWPVVRTYDDDIVIAYPDEWKYEDNGIVRATIRQVPLRLAWAITIHKSQGMTLDAAEIDLGDAFEPGMGYVALSRVRSLNGLKLMNLNQMALKVHPKILEQDIVFKNNSMALVQHLQDLSQNEMIQSQRKTLIERFEGYVDKVITKNLNQTNKKTNKKTKKIKPIANQITTLEMLKKELALELIAEACEVSVGTVIKYIEKLINLEQIKHAELFYLKNSIPQEEFELIFAELKLSEDGRLRPVYDKFEGKYNYFNIKLVQLFLDAKN